VKAPKSPKKEKKKEECEVSLLLFQRVFIFIFKNDFIKATAPAPEEVAKDEPVAAEPPVVEAAKEEVTEPVKETETAPPAPVAEAEEPEKVKSIVRQP
jgi:hypothetical protein